MARLRPPAVAGLFYPSAPADCLRELERCRAAAGPDAAIPPGCRAVAALAPHAGWSYSGAVAAAALAPLEAAAPDTVLLFGADHYGLRRGRASVWPDGAWATPVGEVAVDAETAAALVSDPGSGVDAAPEAHGREHSLEVLVPFLVGRFPGARIVPILTPPGSGAAAVGVAAVRAARRVGRRPVAVGSSDLTHYGERYDFSTLGTGAAAHRWSKEENDREILDRVLAFDPEGIEASARWRRNACGPGAMAAVTAAAREMGATGARLLRHTTSAEVAGDSILGVGGEDEGRKASLPNSLLFKRLRSSPASLVLPRSYSPGGRIGRSTGRGGSHDEHPGAGARDADLPRAGPRDRGGPARLADGRTPSTWPPAYRPDSGARFWGPDSGGPDSGGPDSGGRFPTGGSTRCLPAPAP